MSFVERITGGVDSFLGWWAKISNRYYLVILLVTLVVTSAGVWRALRLKLESDFEAMLPENYQSVKDLRRYQNEVGSTSILSIGLTHVRDIEAAKRFADDLVGILETDLADKVHYCEYNIKAVRDFFRNHSLLYLDEEEIEKKYVDLKEYIGERKLKKTGLFVDLDEEEDEEKGDKKEPPFDLDELISEYNKKAAGGYGTRQDGYYINEKEDLLAISVYPEPGFSGVEKARILIAEVEKKIKELDPKKYDAHMEYGFAGPVQVSLDEYDAIRKDILGTISICVSLIIAVLLLYFLRARQIILIAATLFIGITITMGITKEAIGYLNAQTAFLGSIIVGTGINYSIILLARYT